MEVAHNAQARLAEKLEEAERECRGLEQRLAAMQQVSAVMRVGIASGSGD